MKKVLVLGSGFVSRPLIRYLLDQPHYQLTVTSLFEDEAEAIVAGHPSGTVRGLSVDETDEMEHLIADHDLAVSLLPAPLHPRVAELCVKHRKHMVTTSYVSDEMRALDKAARDAGVTLINEVGVDPGLDHMSAMRVIHDVRTRGGTITSFKSLCGGLPAPEDNDNPWGYKFSWSPRGVLAAGKNSAVYRDGGREVTVPAADLFSNARPIEIEGLGEMEWYPNRHSLIYIDLYDFENIDTMVRGTLRYPGWSDTLLSIVRLGLLDETKKTWPAGTTMRAFIADVSGLPQDNLRSAMAKKLAMGDDSAVLERFAWLGFFGDDPAPVGDGEPTTAMDVLANHMNKRMAYTPHEHDMIVMQHEFVAEFADDRREVITSTLIERGHQPDGHAAMARTVSLPAAIAAKLVLNRVIKRQGVQIPVTGDFYMPILNELEKLGIRFEEHVVENHEAVETG
jgi:saccharopine dehydrogenase (NADP+, L-glutamate forming)